MAAQINMSSPPTVQVYQYDETLREHPTRITSVCNYADISSEEQSLFKTGSVQTYAIEFSDTIFYVQGGGQPCDVGYISANTDADKSQMFNVEAVRYQDGIGGRVLHFGHFVDDAQFQKGDMVTQHIDGERRNLNSRVHTAGHLVSLSVRRLAEQTPELDVAELKASHYPGASFVEFKGVIDNKYKDSIQSQASQFVSDALPVKLYWHTPEDLHKNGVITVEGMPLVAGHDGKVRVVDIVGAGAYPCGGTHTPDSSFVGAITVKSVKRQKGISKISYAVADK